MSDTASLVSVWAAEDGGPRREQTVPGALGASRLELAAHRDAVGTTMVVLGAPGEVFVLRHTLGRRPLRDPHTVWIERVDPQTLEPLERSPDLPAGPFWPGGCAVHPSGDLHVVAGNHAHRLGRDLRLLASRELPVRRPHNSFVTLPDGTLVTKDLDRAQRAPATLHLLDPETLRDRAPALPLGEPSIARLSADADDVYVIGTRGAMRARRDGDRLALDDWRVDYVASGASHGWDPVVAGGHLWWMDNGEHEFVTTMRGAGVAPGPVHLLRAALDDPTDVERIEVCGLPRGAITNPPLFDARREIAVAFDSANGVLAAFRFDGALTPLWRRELGHAAHLLLFAESGELVAGDFHGPAFARTRLGRAVGRRLTAPLRHERLRPPGVREDVVVLDVETGLERARVAVPTLVQSVVFPAPGFDRDVYWCSMTALARVVAR